MEQNFSLLEPEQLLFLGKWLNDNQGIVSVILFAVTLYLGWVSGIISSLRRKPKFRIEALEGPTFTCTFGIGKMHGQYHLHRTGIAIYLKISNIGSAPASIDSVAVGYHWCISPFSLIGIRYRLGYFWIANQNIIISDFQHAVGENTKVYPFLTQRSHISGTSTDTYLEIGRSANGVAYFEQADSYNGCFPLSNRYRVKLKVRVTDTFGGIHTRLIYVQRVTLTDALKYNPHFGHTLATIRGETPPIELPYDSHGNLLVNLPTNAEVNDARDDISVD